MAQCISIKNLIDSHSINSRAPRRFIRTTDSHWKSFARMENHSSLQCVCVCVCDCKGVGVPRRMCVCVCVGRVCGFSIWRSAHFNLVVRRKRFELVFPNGREHFPIRKRSSSWSRRLPIGALPREICVAASRFFSHWSRIAKKKKIEEEKKAKICARFDFLARFSLFIFFTADFCCT